MYVFQLVLMACIGSLFTFLGWRIWKKEQITLIHEYHYTKVTDENKKSYTQKMGKAMIVMGIGMFLSGIVNFLTHTSYGLIILGISLVGGLILMICSQIKYNHEAKAFF